MSQASSTSHAPTIRPATVADAPVLAYHRVAMFRDMGHFSRDLESPLEQATDAYLRDAMPRGEYLAWVAADPENGDSIIGGAGVQLRPLMPRPRKGESDLELGPEALVLNVYVESAWRRRGVAEALMRTLLDALAARGIRRIVLHPSTEGRPLYARLGFKQTDEMRLGG